MYKFSIIAAYPVDNMGISFIQCFKNVNSRFLNMLLLNYTMLYTQLY